MEKSGFTYSAICETAAFRAEREEAAQKILAAAQELAAQVRSGLVHSLKVVLTEDGVTMEAVTYDPTTVEPDWVEPIEPFDNHYSHFIND